MKFAVITDVHGNAPALQAVLKKIDESDEIDHIYCLGDMIGIGPDTNQVLELLFARQDLSMVTGNHDEAILALIQGHQYPLSHSHVKKHHLWIAERINPAFVSKLQDLPRTIRKNISGKSVLFTHYHIKVAKQQVPISEDPFANITDPSLANMEQLFSGYSEELICFGHHHPLHFFTNQETVYLNPGSLGCNSTPSAPYGIVSVEGGRVNVSLASAAYDNREFLRSYEKLKVPEREFILNVFHGNQLAKSE